MCSKIIFMIFAVIFMCIMIAIRDDSNIDEEDFCDDEEI